jgi:hypothetical protein
MEDAASRCGAGVRAVALAAPQLFYRDPMSKSSTHRGCRKRQRRTGEAPAARPRAVARARGRMQGEAGEAHAQAERKDMTTARARAD